MDKHLLHLSFLLSDESRVFFTPHPQIQFLSFLFFWFPFSLFQPHLLAQKECNYRVEIYSVYWEESHESSPALPGSDRYGSCSSQNTTWTPLAVAFPSHWSQWFLQYFVCFMDSLVYVKLHHSVHIFCITEITDILSHWIQTEQSLLYIFVDCNIL